MPERQQEELNMKKINVRRMTELSLLMAIVLLMAFTPLGYLNTPWGVQITFIVIPVAVGSIVLGPGAGAFLGLVFGITSFINAFQSAMGAMMLQSSVIGTFAGCVLPRILVGWLPGLMYQGFREVPKLQAVNIPVCCLLTPALNTLLFMTVGWLLFSDMWMDIAVAAGYSGEAGLKLLGFMFVMVAANGIAEVLACLIIGTAVCRTLIKVLHKDDARH